MLLRLVLDVSSFILQRWHGGRPVNTVRNQGLFKVYHVSISLSSLMVFCLLCVKLIWSLARTRGPTWWRWWPPNRWRSWWSWWITRLGLVRTPGGAGPRILGGRGPGYGPTPCCQWGTSSGTWGVQMVVRGRIICVLLMDMTTWAHL